ncbi:MAG TPA: Uma2 family endonuclease [Terracidiphilus sp.]|jgi:Uma2 family endonuclease|nr:Uma2 family endonuclease [Terracidiphilus sp.]
MGATTHISEADYLHSVFEPDAEYVDGEVRERPMGTYDHNDWQQAIQRWFVEHAKEWNIRSVPEQRMRVKSGRYRIPDVSVLDRANPKEQVVTLAPIAVFEVLSPEDRVQELYEKLDDYVGMGIPHIWVLDPRTGIFKRYADAGLMPLLRFEYVERGIAFDLVDIAALLQN